MIWGAIYGDIIGSYYEWHSTKNLDFPLHPSSKFTDDTVMTAAVCDAIAKDANICGPPNNIKKRAEEYAAQFKRYYSMYPDAGFGQRFAEWARFGKIYKQNSFGNGGAMCVSPIGWAYGDLKRVLWEAKASCLITHTHPEAVAGAQAVAAAIFLARSGKSKKEIQTYLEKTFKYNLSRDINEIRKTYRFEVRTKNSIPEAIIAFLHSEDYESAVRNAVSLGGDADTQACIAGGIAEAFYGKIPEEIAGFCNLRADITIKRAVNNLCDMLLKD